MERILTVVFRDVEDASDVNLRSIPGNEEQLVLKLEGAQVVVRIKELQMAMDNIRDFDKEEKDVLPITTTAPTPISTSS